jgi:hypothetical protein
MQFTKTILTPILALSALALATAAFAQTPVPPVQRPPNNAVPQRPAIPAPSSFVTAPLPAQDVVVTYHLTSDQATALEKRRRDVSKPTADPTSGLETMQPINATLAAQIAADAALYFGQLAAAYPSTAVQAAQQDAAAKAKAAKDMAAAVGVVKAN